jgi:Rrf2 family protein
MDGMLRISKAAMLGIHALACMATGDVPDPVTASALAGRLAVSEAHLGKVLQRLAKQGLLYSRKGPVGGFTLARPAKSISLLQILEAIDGPSTRGHCVIEGDPPHGASCLIDKLFRQVYEQVHRSLGETVLSDGAICMPCAAAAAADDHDPLLLEATAEG